LAAGHAFLIPLALIGEGPPSWLTGGLEVPR